MGSLLHPVYFPNIRTMAHLARGPVTWEVWDNYQKQTYRNRCYICADRGRQMLNIPIRHTGKQNGRQLYREVCPDNSYPWQRQHWRGLQTAYRSAPFFEFYEADLEPLFTTRFESLLELNLASTALLCDLLGLGMPQEQTESYREEPEGLTDRRRLVDAKSDTGSGLPPYPQVFGERHGFIGNVSCLDLLFNEGPSAREYLLQLPIS
ncbi:MULTISPECIES: WbqC family protein [unclassified Robiginitalea]|uniref:WbqC family protein n=1 Tax=Robiginitalea TaxID=252306 RepID=UPI00234BE2A9|nr:MULTISPECIES: WbqC family protein [unclassified Robiginitalea]MDC6354824.1 WbqC family protein [Robiginitalea sp. PM2]MDC6375090.1 WbqC family protein [Robiginitalea sp. SP8]